MDGPGRLAMDGCIVQTHGGKSPEEARAFVEEDLMKSEKRYRRDVY